MSNLVQIIYISRSASAPANPANGVDPVVARILAHSRSNNRRNGLVGVLYFGDGCFFQCLEGEQQAVRTLYAKLEQDPRHRDLKIISSKPIDAITFTDWSMKYVASEKDMAVLLRRHGMNSFDPYQFTEAVIQEVIELLHGATENVPEPAAQVSPQAAPVRPAAPASAAAGGMGKPAMIGLALLAVAAGVWVVMFA